MKRILILAACALSGVSISARMADASDVIVKDINVDRDGSKLDIAFNLDLRNIPGGINKETRLIPVVKNGNDSVRLHSVTLAGKNRMIQAERTGAIKSETTDYYRLGKISELPYSVSIDWEPWMDNADIDLIVENLGCCESRKTIGGTGLARLDLGERSFAPDLVYVTPVEERVKMRNARGEAYVDFVVNTTNIRPDYRNNPAELRKIRATVDSVKADPDTKITSLSITGYASPEGAYANNERLAKGRTEALAEYVRNLYTFPKNIMKTSWVAEDWAGLKKFVEESSINHKAAILTLIDSNLAPDVKDRKIASDYPTEYRFMLQNWYPALRHSDYTVEYEVRKYTDPAEIAKVFDKNPSKLSLREFFIYAETLDPTSDRYADVFETAAKMYPGDATANLNAGNSALSRNDLASAAKYLEKAGDTPQAEYARGVLAAKQGDYTKAMTLFAKAKAGGIDTSGALKALERMTAPKIINLTENK